MTMVHELPRELRLSLSTRQMRLRHKRLRGLVVLSVGGLALVLAVVMRSGWLG